MALSILSLVMIVSFVPGIETNRELISVGPFPKATIVRITNQVGGDTALTVHCKSKDDDIGFQTLAPNTSWEFSFNPLYFTTGTLFFCRMEWPGSWHYFDIYKQERDERRCHLECFWNIVPSGPCDSKSGQCYPWKHVG